MKTAFFYLVLTLLFTGCNKDRKTLSPQQVPHDLEEQIAFGLENMDNDNLLILFRNDKGKMDWDVTKTSDKRYSNQIYMKRHDCEGNAVEVARCSKKIIDAGGCVVAGKTGDNYWSDKVKCPI